MESSRFAPCASSCALLLLVAATTTSSAIASGANGYSYRCDHGHSGPPDVAPSRPLPDRRPPVAQRSFRSPAVDAALAELVHLPPAADGQGSSASGAGRTWKDPELATLLQNCLPNTLDTTVWQSPTTDDPRTFLSTGDIAAMWLRDSQNQILPYIRYAKAEPGDDGIGGLIRGLIRRHVDSVLLDPYANSFTYTPSDIVCDPGAWFTDNSTKLDPSGSGQRVNGMSQGVFQRKWEMDSLSSVLRLGRLYHEATGDAAPFANTRWLGAVELILQTFEEQQRPLTPDNFTRVNYTFQTLTQEPKDTSAHGIGRGHRWTGMIRTSFLPSDDSVRLPYHIPGNAFAVVELNGTAAMLRRICSSSPSASAAASSSSSSSSSSPSAAFCGRAQAVAAKAAAMASTVDAGIWKWGTYYHSLTGERIFAMEVDGYGNTFFADDANVPSLLSLPYLGYVAADDPIYLETRRLLLDNTTNPMYFGASDLADLEAGHLGGIGSEDASGNAGLGHVWALSLTMRLLTRAPGPAGDPEAKVLLKALVESSGGTGLMHESFWYTDPSVFTRSWFAMANSALGYAVMDVVDKRPELLFAS